MRSNCPYCGAKFDQVTLLKLRTFDGTFVTGGSVTCATCLRTMAVNEVAGIHHTDFSGYQYSARRSPRLIKAGAITAGLSALAFLKNFTFITDPFNKSNSMYEQAQFFSVVSVIGFVVGLVLLIIGLWKRSR